ncbi:hypothetical protein D3C86_1423070 [compost metagenome]
MRDLHFLEVGIHPHLVQRHHGHQRRARAHALAHLHRALGHVAGDRRGHRRAREGEVGRTQVRGGALHIGMFLNRGLVGQHLVRGELLLRGQQRRFGGLQRGLRMRNFFVRHRARAGNRLAAAQVVARLGHVGLAHRHVGGERAVVHIERAYFAHGLGELGLRLFHGHLGVGAVELDQRLPGGDELRVVGGDRDHRTAHQRRDLHHVARYVGIVGVLEMARVDAPVQAIAKPGHDDGGGQRHQQAAALAIVVGGRDRGLWRGRLGSVAHDVCLFA